ncbi:MAG TPA: hypothetical protein VM686_24780, partial [Polyangiaceae bacterium]|nr:hypothetical protein [Polyangiaceae bacterium]
MKYRAIAAATERSNAVGTVELECTPEGLALVYQGVGSFAEGYAPAALAQGAHLLVPWSSVQEAYVEGEQVFVGFDPVLAPHNRLSLGNFSTGQRVHHHELYRRRVLVRTAGIAAAVVAALLALSIVARLAPDRGPALAITVAALSAAAILVVAVFADKLLVYGGVEAEAARESFTFELRAHLPSLARLPAAQPKQRAPRTLSEFQGLIPRTTFAIVLTLTASGLGAVLMARYLLWGEREPEHKASAPRARATEEPRETAAAALAAPPPPRPAPRPAASAASPAALTPSASAGEECRCARADSPLWQDPLPKVSLLIISQKVRMGRGEGESQRRKYSEIEVAVINNSRDEIKEVSLVVFFYAREDGKERELVSNRPLFFEGPLMPAQAIKWSVEAEGTEFEIQNPILGTIGDDGENAAPADRAAELLNANHRPVRLHGALLLTFLGDPRAREAVLRLREALREDEAPYLTRLLDAQNDLRVCRLKPNSNGTVAGCLHNFGAEPKKDIGVKLRALAQA